MLLSWFLPKQQFEFEVFKKRYGAFHSGFPPQGAVYTLPQAAGQLRLSEEPHEAPHGRETTHLSVLWEELQSER